MTTASLALAPVEAAAVRAILKRRLPRDVQVFVFGSRAGGRVRRMSDLDLLLQGEGPLDSSLIAALAEDFDESDLRWRVDLVDRASITTEFARIVDAGKIPFPLDEAC
jgi:uncharacterized protein